MSNRSLSDRAGTETEPEPEPTAEERVAHVRSLADGGTWPDAGEPTPVPIDEVIDDVTRAIGSDRVRVMTTSGRWPLPVVLGDRDRLSLAFFLLFADTLDRSAPRPLRARVAQSPRADGVEVELRVTGAPPVGPAEADEHIAAVFAEHHGRLDRSGDLIAVHLPA